MDSIKLRKGATRIKANGETVSEKLISITTHADLLKWNPGDELMVEQDKAKDRVIVTRIKRKEESK